mgnify:CR=1 FL=1
MKKERYFDIKWVIILAIVAFLVVFQVFPLLYLIYRSFFTDGHFSLEGFKRIYSYSLNWTCLKKYTDYGRSVHGVWCASGIPVGHGWWAARIFTEKKIFPNPVRNHVYGSAFDWEPWPGCVC